MSQTHLSEEPNQFVRSLEMAIKAVRSCRTGISFLHHFIGLIQTLRVHPITTDWIKGLEEESQKRKEAFNISALDALETEWLFLWKKYPQRKSRRDLIRIKQFFTRGREQSSQLPFEHTCFSFQEFKIKYHCNECSAEFAELIKQNQQLHAARAPKIYEEYIQTCLEADVVYFWDRLCLLERIYQFSTDVSVFEQEISRDKWSNSRYLHWKREESKALQWVLGLAKKYLWERFEGDGFRSEKKELSLPLSADCKFSRTDCENYLDRLFIDVCPLVSGLQQKTYEDKEPGQPVGGKTRPQQKLDELIKHTKEYWDKFPKASYDEAYAYYCDRCRFPKPYSRPEWERKVRKLRLDPRPPKEKVRGNSKKGR